MNDSFSPYPLLETKHYVALGYVAEKLEFSYTENFEEYPLQVEISSESTTVVNGRLKDPRCSWYPETHNLRVQRNYRITSAYCLFGEDGIAPSNAIIGIALQWISSRSNERGIIPFGEITRLDAGTTYQVEYNFDRGKLKGSLKLQTVLYLKDSKTPRASEMYFAQQAGTILGILDQAEIYIDGNGSIFPIVVIEAPGKPLWHVYYNETADATQDKFESENVELRLNKAHPNYDALKIEASIVESPLFLEVISSALMVIVESTKESLGEDWDTVLSGAGFESGSIAEAIYYFVTRLQWDISSPARLSASIKEFFEKSS